MILSSVLIAIVVGFVQGFVGIATTVNLVRPLAALITTQSRSEHAFSDPRLRPRLFGWLACAIAFVALFIMHIVVGEVTIGALCAGDRTARWELGRLWTFAMVAGLALARLIPVLESKIRKIGTTL
jgi:hypothetical protein